MLDAQASHNAGNASPVLAEDPGTSSRSVRQANELNSARENKSHDFSAIGRQMVLRLPCIERHPLCKLDGSTATRRQKTDNFGGEGTWQR
jgi:hypothetical protein